MNPKLAISLAVLLAAFSAGAGAVGNLADVTVFDRSAGRPLAVYWQDGRAYVVGNPGNEYQVTVRNRRGGDLLAVMSVDGVNAVTGQTASVHQSGYVLAPGGAVEVRGWRKDLSRTAAFYFTALPDSYAARTGRPDNVGTIGVALFRRRLPEPAPAPQDIAPAAPLSKLQRSEATGAASRDSAGATAEAPLGTGHGRSEHSPARRVAFERATTEPAETVVIYYDSYRNLLARGVVRPVPAPRPVPQPFPAFVPDPPA
jgi:hypothetical protein